MPWLLNPQNTAQTVTLRNGMSLRLPARKRYYLEPEQMSGDIQAKVTRRLIRNMGGDKVVKQQEVKSDTSSHHHSDHDMVGAVSEGNFVTETVKKKRSAKKRATAKKASSGKKRKSDN